MIQPIDGEGSQLSSLCGFRLLIQLRPEHNVPEAASHSKPVLVVLVVVIHVVPFQLLIKARKPDGRTRQQMTAR